MTFDLQVKSIALREGAIEVIEKLCAQYSCSVFTEECSRCLEWAAGKDWPSCQYASERSQTLTHESWHVTKWVLLNFTQRSNNLNAVNVGEIPSLYYRKQLVPQASG